MSDDRPENDPVVELARVVMRTQGHSMALYEILSELVLRVARGQPDPSEFLKGMYNTILDRVPAETAAKTAHGDEQEVL